MNKAKNPGPTWTLSQHLGLRPGAPPNQISQSADSVKLIWSPLEIMGWRGRAVLYVWKHEGEKLQIRVQDTKSTGAKKCHSGVCSYSFICEVSS